MACVAQALKLSRTPYTANCRQDARIAGLDAALAAQRREVKARTEEGHRWQQEAAGLQAALAAERDRHGVELKAVAAAHAEEMRMQIEQGRREVAVKADLFLTQLAQEKQTAEQVLDQGGGGAGLQRAVSFFKCLCCLVSCSSTLNHANAQHCVVLLLSFRRRRRQAHARRQQPQPSTSKM